jgi:hypothetical protein
VVLRVRICVAALGAQTPGLPEYTKTGNVSVGNRARFYEPGGVASPKVLAPQQTTMPSARTPHVVESPALRER